MDRKTLEKLEFNKIILKLKEFTSSVTGGELAEALSPSADISEIVWMQKETSDALMLSVKRGIPPLGGIRDIRSSLKRAEISASLNPGELLNVADVLRVSRSLKKYTGDDSGTVEGNYVAEYIRGLAENRILEDRINSAIISPEEISDSASTTLNNIRRKIKNLQGTIKDTLDGMVRSQSVKKYIQEAIVTIREDRYVIPVKAEYKNEVHGLVHDSSASGATLFIEPMAVVEANNEIKEQKIKEKAEIERILSELTQSVIEMLDALKENIRLLARIDFAFAKSKLSAEYRCTSPNLNSEGRVIIKKGRHPLLDKKTVVPIDFWIGTDFRSLILTGPNTGGKTVTLKTVGLFVLMAQAGLHVPANDGTEISVFQKVFADIGDEQSIEQSLSTFSSHMTNIVRILANADEHSLVLLDELGAGTDPTEGAALAMSIIENLCNRGAITVATTHYSELKIYALTTPGIENASCEFDVDTLSPKFTLLIGVPGKSNAFAISARLGLQNDILERANQFLKGEDIRFEDVLKTMDGNRRASEQARIEAEKLKIEAKELSG
ncbi:MAG: endonuclease MutS2, partial [Eubacteriales bacterium]|nr:endonuclease MutS2 [Eubacteriales bacterium]